jgi:lactoylglutathione lyase
MMFGLRTAVYRVDDLEAAKKWYSKAFKTEPYFDEPYYVGFNIAGYELGLQPDKSVKGDSILAYWGVEDIQAEYNSFIKLGAIEHEKPMNVGGELMVCSVKDPWGNIIGLIYNPYFKLPE